MPALPSRNNAQPASTFGSYIKQLRAQKQLSLRALREKTGISLSSLHRVEAGHYVPSVTNNVESIDKLWMALGGDMTKLLYLSRRCPTCHGLMKR